MKVTHNPDLPFNTPLETGIRSIAILVAAFPETFDLHRMVAFDHLVVHTGDIGGPESLHPRVPLRTAELLVRRSLVERGLLLMMSRGLADRLPTEQGIMYRAGDLSDTFLASLSAPYVAGLRQRASWVIENFGGMTEEEFRRTMDGLFDRWIEQFQMPRLGVAGDS